MTEYPVTPPNRGPSCYRHEGRETYIRCSRCDRPICPECMVSASVGFHCPECVREGEKTVRQPRTAFGGAHAAGSHVTFGIIGLCVVVFLLQQAVGESFTFRLQLLGLGVDDAGLVGVSRGEYYRLLTATLLHASVLHLALNMYALYLFGPPLEAELGKIRYLALYVLSGLGGSALSYAFLGPGSASVGASGAVLGLLGATLVVNQRMNRDSRGLWVLLGINVAFGFLAQGTVDWRAHLGGLVAGALAATALVYAPRPRRTAIQAGGLAVTLLLTLLVVAYRTHELRSYRIATRGVPSAMSVSAEVPSNGLVHSVDKSCGGTTPV